MVDILHRVGIESDPGKVYSALTTLDGLTGWWTADSTGTGDEIDGILQFRFAAGGFDMKVRELEPEKGVRWQVVDGPEEWIGTYVDFRLTQKDDYTIVLFRHEGWREPVEFMHHCSTKWGSYLMSMKALVETGKGAAHPNDVRIDDWD
ncbi:SRPBCC domain-containing protein [Nocardia sp. 2]|uniref:SRPBCC domain-containing protein n=1 Tax=Nocardia acididurans TaxID=2802282 RepID=A0ABS1MJD0_9NOCA|nr:SRPBCC domain-containing protein [Nocardia acididurans]MBL1080155.1 SRPBCC domain-containing protein [Nocardia acididurans]